MRKINIEWKKFFAATAVILLLLLIADVVYDKLWHTLVWKAIFTAENLLIKTATACIGAYFYASKD